MDRLQMNPLLLAAALLLYVVVVPVAVTGTARASSEPRARASAGVKKQVKSLKRQVNRLKVDVEELSKLPGPPGPPGEQGEQGPPGSLGPAGGDLTGDYPDPSIAAGAVSGEKLAGGAVTSPKLANSAVTSSKIADESITGADIFNFSIGLIDLAGNSVNSAKVADNTLTGSDIDEATLDLQVERVEAFSSNSSESPKTVVASCPAGKRVVGTGAWIFGGGLGSPPNQETRVVITRLSPMPGEHVAASAIETAGGTSSSWTVIAYAFCARLAG